MKSRLISAMLILSLAACTPSIPTNTPTTTAAPTKISTQVPSPTANSPMATPTNNSPTLTPQSGAQIDGPTNFPPGVDPLTGLKVADASLLNRRPLAIKVENIPRTDRPQFGLSLADLVYEYYTEEGASRFIAVYYGQDASRVGPIRSARFFDANIIRMYKAVFAFGSAWIRVLDRLRQSEFADQLVTEGGNNCPPMCRFEPNRRNFLVTNTAQLSQYITQKGVPNGRQNLDGMLFQAKAPAGGQTLDQLYVRYSKAVYDRWDYDPSSGVYSRSVDQQDAADASKEVYGQLVDQLNKQPITADNVVVLQLTTQYMIQPPKGEVVDMIFTGSGPAYALRDGQVYALQWQRMDTENILQLTFPDGTPYAYKPGNTWYEVIGATSKLEKQSSSWRFTFAIP
jgi:hypothetical protein